MIDQFDELRKDFVIDTQPLVGSVEQILLEIERTLGARDSFEAELGEMMSRLHTVKGNAGMMGYGRIQTLAHRMEDLVKALGAGRVPLSEASLDVLLGAVSSLGAAIRAVADRAEEQVDLEEIQQRITRLLEAPAQAPLAPAPLPAAEGRAPAAASPPAADTIRIDFRKLDHLLNLVGELVIYQTSLGRNVGSLRSGMPAEQWRPLERTAESLGKTVAELQRAVMQTRLLPVSTVFGRFPRMVRDLAKSQGKQIEVGLEGAETEIDKTVLDAVGDPLLHLVRNSVDHGIEPPQVRRAAGKSPQGRIRLSASQAGKQIRIEVADDGHGLDPERIAAKARHLGHDVSGLEPRQILDLIFLPGFSTAERLTELSGRGVGLSVVRSSIERLGGHLIVSSVAGQGTGFSMLVPLTLAIIEALIVHVAGEHYALPITGVLETARLDRQRLHRVGGSTVLQWRGQTVPVLDLGLAFGLGRSALDDAAFAVAVVGAGRLLMLPVTRLLGREELVIKGLDDSLGQTPGIAGATILGTGEVLLVLDLAGLVHSAERSPAAGGR
jgi:two-component system, chemotaxis family, sensor kinase CheA